MRQSRQIRLPEDRLEDIANASRPMRPLLLSLLSMSMLNASALAETSAGNAERGKTLFQQRCALCHADGSDQAGGGQGPSLQGVLGRKAAALSDFPYSKALRALELQWDIATLDRYLSAPGQMVPGTSMPVAVPDATERRDLTAYLATLKAAEQARPAKEAPSGVVGSATQATLSENLASDWRSDAPGVTRRITQANLPVPYGTPSVRNSPSVIERPAGAALRVPPGFTIQPLATGLDGPRLIRTAPNGDLFIAESRAGRVRVMRAADTSRTSAQMQFFAEKLDQPFGMAFYPPGPDPQWIYVATNNSVVRFAYRAGDAKAQGVAQVVVPQLSATTGGHTTRDLAFSPDGKRMFVSVGSASNVAQDVPQKSPDEIRRWEAQHGLGASWGNEANRADVLVFDENGHNGRTFATGIRNCVGLAINPAGGDLWCSTNERDMLGDDLVPDYVTRVREGAFYGWPWYYIGSHEDPRHKGTRPDLAGKVTVPDVLLQPHSAPLQMTFYNAANGAAMFPHAYRGDAFVAFHGSWNRSSRTGYKVVRVRFNKGAPTGEYEDFLTGFVIDMDSVWGRPVGVAVASDGALIVSDDGSGTLWRVAYSGERPRGSE